MGISVPQTILFTSSLHYILVTNITIVETVDGVERGKSPMAMTNVKPWEEYWPSRGYNHRPPVPIIVLEST